jgi:hypothetical protein
MEWVQFSCFFRLACLSARVCVHDGLDLMSLSVPSLYPLLFFLAFQIWEMLLLPFLSFFPFFHEPKPDGEKSDVSTFLPSNRNALSLPTINLLIIFAFVFG